MTTVTNMSMEELNFYRIFVNFTSEDKEIPIYNIDEYYLAKVPIQNKDTYLDAWYKYLSDEKENHSEDFDKWLNVIKFDELQHNGCLDKYSDLPQHKINIDVNTEAIELGKEIRKVLDKFYDDLEAIGDENAFYGYSIGESNCIQAEFYQCYDINAPLPNPDNDKNIYFKKSEYESDNYKVITTLKAQFIHLLRRFSKNSIAFKTSYEGGIITNTSDLKDMKKDLSGNILPNADEIEKEFKQTLVDNDLRKYVIIRYIEIDVYDISTGQSNIEIFNQICKGAGMNVCKYNDDIMVNKLSEVFG